MEVKTYAGIPEELHRYEKAKVVLIPAPYDGTSTWGKGADKGPTAFLNASENMELYDIETQSEPYQIGIHLAEALPDFKSPAEMVEHLQNEVLRHLKMDKFPTIFGGEHSVSIPCIRAFRQHYGQLTVLQIDAHADLRPSYQGTPYNHACAVAEAVNTTKLLQVGIRSMDISEVVHMKRENVFFAEEMHRDPNWIEKVVNKCEGNIYITIDLDAFDPSIMPSTGTPEPGGMQWYETLELLKRVCEERNVVGFDIVELCPVESNWGPDFLAAKLYYKILAYLQHKWK